MFSVFVVFNSASQTDTVFIYNLRGCGRCGGAETFVKKHKLPYRLYFTDIQNDFRQLGILMDAVGLKKGEELSFPVVVYKGKTHYNIPDLDKFLNSLVDIP